MKVKTNSALKKIRKMRRKTQAGAVGYGKMMIPVFCTMHKEISVSGNLTIEISFSTGFLFEKKGDGKVEQ